MLLVFSLSLFFPRSHRVRYKLSYQNPQTLAARQRQQEEGEIQEDITLVSVDESIPSMLAGSVGFFGSVDDFSATISPTAIDDVASLPFPQIIKMSTYDPHIFMESRPATGQNLNPEAGVHVVLHDAEQTKAYIIYLNEKELGWVRVSKKRWSQKATVMEGGGSVLIKDIVAIETGIRTASFVGSPNDRDCFSILTERGTLDVEVKGRKREKVIGAIRRGIEGGLRVV